MREPTVVRALRMAGTAALSCGLLLAPLSLVPEALAQGPPPAPVLMFPSGAITNPTPTYRWNPSAGATRYFLQVGDGSTILGQGLYNASDVCSGASCSAALSGVLSVGSYGWAVEAQNPFGTTWSDGMNFSVQAPAAPSPLSPNGPLTTARPTYTWTPSAGATQYYLEVHSPTERVVQGLYQAGEVCSGSTCSATPPKVLPIGSYTWFVEARHAGGGAWSAGKSFTLGCAVSVVTGDFNGDSRTDRLCSTEGATWISLSTGPGFVNGTPWLSAQISEPFAGDFNGDGLSDVAGFDSATGVVSVALSTGTGLSSLAPWGTASATEGSCVGSNAKTGTGDFNGDGRTDVSCKLKIWDDRVFVGLSSGSGFSFGVFGHALCEAGERTGTLDLEGDGKDDWYCLGTTSDQLRVFPSTGSGFLPVVLGADESFCDDIDYVFGDWNGDGRTDLACTRNGKVRLSTGSGFLDQGAFGRWCFTPTGLEWPYAFGADVDGDGTAEMVCSGTGSAGAGITVRKWMGTWLGPEEVWLSGFCWDTVKPGDFDGDGKADLLCENTQASAVAGTSNLRADLLIKARGVLGGTVEVAYTPSTTFPNNPGTPMRPLVNVVTARDARGWSSTTSYSYAGGKMDRQEREFLGFATVRVTLPCLPGESACPYTETSFSQTLASAGRPLAVKRHDGAGELLAKQELTYTEGAGLPRTSLLTQTDSFAYDSSGGSLHTYATYAYDSYGNVIQTFSGGDADRTGDELQIDSTFVPNTSAYIVNRPGKVEQREPRGSALTKVEYEYDDSGNWNVPPSKGDLTAVRSYLDRGDRYVTRKMTYNPQGALTKLTDETNRPVRTIVHDPAHELFPYQITSAGGETTALLWDPACGVVKTVTDPNNQATTATYDVLCRPKRTDLPLGGYVERFYLELGNPGVQRTRTETNAPTGVSGADWRETLFDGLGRTYRTVKRGPSPGQDIMVESTYNARGGLASTTEPFYEGEAARTTRYHYDALDRQVRTVLPDLAEVKTSYGASSRTTSDPNGKPATVRFDAYGREVAAERPLDGQTVTTRKRYDALGRLVGIEDAVGNHWIYAHDSLGRLREEWDPDAGHWVYDPDDAGRPETQTDAKNQVMRLTYNTAGRLETKTSPAGTVSYAYSEARAGFFNVGRLTTVTSPSDVLRVDYDSLGRAVRHTRTLSGVDYVAEKAYDAGGYHLSTTYPDSDVVGPLGYDEAGRLRSIPGIISDISYDAAGRPQNRTNANRTVTSWTYTADRGFLDTIGTTSSSGTVQALDHDFDAAGLLQQVTSAVVGESWSYGYDDLYRMISATNLINPAESQSFDYDEIGRMRYNSRVGTYTYPLAGQPRPHAPLTVNGSLYSYDLNGNLSSGGGRAPIWDAENRITQVGATQFGYDGFGERLKKTTGSSTSLYPLGDDYEITNGEVTKYVSVEGLGVIAKRVGYGPGAATFWLHTDRLGSIQAVTDAAGAAVFRRTYRPYGETLTQGGNHTESRGWIDQRNDTETGLTFLHARYFDTGLGVFLSPDPLGPAGDVNAYAYGYGDPINGTDRSGLVVCHFDPCDEGTENKVGLVSGSGDPKIGMVWNGERWVYTTVSAGGAIFAPWVIADLLGGGGSSSSGSGTAAGSSTGFRDARRAERELTIAAIDVPLVPPTGSAVPPTGAPAGAAGGSSTGPTTVDKAFGYFLNATVVPARLIDSWFPEHDRNNWFDRALDSVSPEEELLLGVAGSLAGGPRARVNTIGRARSANRGLEIAIRWLGPGYREIAPGVYRSADGLRQFRITNADILGRHGKIGPHFNFETFDAATGRTSSNIHMPIFEP